MNTITFDKPTFDRFRKQYNDAVSNKQEIFVFQGYEILTSYAKYMIEYLVSRLN